MGFRFIDGLFFFQNDILSVLMNSESHVKFVAILNNVESSNVSHISSNNDSFLYGVSINI